MKEILNNQYKNLFLWTPFVMAFGAALYFSIEQEPNFHFPILITLLLCGIIYKYKNVMIRACALFLFGFFYAMSFMNLVDTPQIKDSFDFINITATVQDIDFTEKSTRLLLNVNAKQIDSELPDKNMNLRISVPNDSNIPDIGDTINGDAKIFHPSGKYAPDSFDFARWAYFSKISGTGFFKDYEIQQTNTKHDIRTHIHDQANSVLTDALVLGYKHTIPKSENDIWQSVGVGHVWSISGFHMTLLGGWLFALFYLIFRAIPYITKRIPAKYPAIICAWLGLCLYLCISGISVATTRAFLMTTLVFAAILFGRNILSLRNAVLAFLIIFLINPFFVMHAGFQLSFAAIFGLVYFFQDSQYIKRSVTSKIIHYVLLSFKTALIATIFTLPFIIAHFGYFPIYSLIGNIVILPLFSFAIMPLVVIGTICALFGSHFILDITNNIYNFALSIATYISNMPSANLSMPFMSNYVLLLLIIGLLFLILIIKTDSKNFLIRNINYVLCIIFTSAALLIYTTQSKPLFYATPDHELVAFNVNEHLQFNKSRSSAHYFAFNSWYEFNNEEIPDKNKRYKCDHGLCVYKTQNWGLAYMQNFTAILNNIEKVCADKNINYIVTTFDINSPKCNAKILKDGILIYPNGHITTISNRRPWHNQH